ncbi:TPA: hypothetical protein ON570_004931 [Citrobacter werkmanii]|nr:hypothetical protein [Citrobacter werkmanii]
MAGRMSAAQAAGEHRTGVTVSWGTAPGEVVFSRTVAPATDRHSEAPPSVAE